MMQLVGLLTKTATYLFTSLFITFDVAYNYMQHIQNLTMMLRYVIKYCFRKVLNREENGDRLCSIDDFFNFNILFNFPKTLRCPSISDDVDRTMTLDGKENKQEL